MRYVFTSDINGFLLFVSSLLSCLGMEVVKFNFKSYVTNEAANFRFCSKNITRIPAFSIDYVQKTSVESFWTWNYVFEILLGLNLLGFQLFQQRLSLNVKIQTMVEIIWLTCYGKHGRNIHLFKIYYLIILNILFCVYSICMYRVYSFESIYKYLVHIQRCVCIFICKQILLLKKSGYK